MFEEIISALQGMDVGFEEMPDEGMLQVQVGEMDKMQLIEVLNMVTSMGMNVTQLDETLMTIAGTAPAPIEDTTAEAPAMDDAAQQAALDEALAGM
jgi:hypothetical protein